MAEVHQLITRFGIDEARRQAATKHERHLVEAAYRVLSEDAEKMGFTYSGFALTSLPHKPQTDLVWRREGHNLTLLLESGRQRSGKPLGLPMVPMRDLSCCFFRQKPSAPALGKSN